MCVLVYCLGTYTYVFHATMYCTDRSELGKNINTDEAAALGMYVYLHTYIYKSSIHT